MLVKFAFAVARIPVIVFIIRHRSLVTRTFYQLLQQRPDYYSNWNWEHGEAVKHFPNGSAVLEIGCGTGSFLKRVQSTCRVAGLELNKSAIAVARAEGLNVYDELIEEHAKKNPEAYDVVCAFQVFEHIYEVKPFIEAALRCLKPGGKLVFGVPNNNPYLYKYDRLHTLNLPPHHSGLWDIASLKKLPDFFAMKNVFLFVEPLYQHQYFAHQLKSHLTEKRSLLRFIPGSFLGVVTKLLKRYIQGRNLLVGYQKA
jgi:SAM-dependent methyltransferase